MRAISSAWIGQPERTSESRRRHGERSAGSLDMRQPLSETLFRAGSPTSIACRRPPSWPPGSPRHLLELVAAGVEAAQIDELAEGVGQRDDLVLVEAQPLQLHGAAKGLGHSGKLVAVEVQVGKCGQRGERVGQLLELVAHEIEVLERLHGEHLLRHGGQLPLREVELAEIGQVGEGALLERLRAAAQVEARHVGAVRGGESLERRHGRRVRRTAPVVETAGADRAERKREQRKRLVHAKQLLARRLTRRP